MTAPTPLPESPWHFPDPASADDSGVVGLGADLEPSTLIKAYSSGLFPMPVEVAEIGDTLAWWSPPLRGVLELSDLKVSRSLRQSCRRYDISINVAFNEVIAACATLPREGGWISDEMQSAYSTLHDLGYAHSVEVWDDDRLVGGLYGVQVAGLFAGESMFHRATDASKVALVGLVSALEACGVVLLDVQWATEHLASLGVCEIPRSEYLARLQTALRCQSASLAEYSGRDAVRKSTQFLDRIPLRPTGGNSAS